LSGRVQFFWQFQGDFWHFLQESPLFSPCKSL